MAKRMSYGDGARFAALIRATGVSTDVHKRWEQGVGHRNESMNMALMLAFADWQFLDGALDLRFGGDGDNGEVLAYLFDILFDAREALELKIPEAKSVHIEDLMD
jgi:hypothetical protein